MATRVARVAAAHVSVAAVHHVQAAHVAAAGHGDGHTDPARFNGCVRGAARAAVCAAFC